MNGILILRQGNDNLAYGLTFGDMRKAIQRLPQDDIEQVRIERVSSVEIDCPTQDKTIALARSWALDFLPDSNRRQTFSMSDLPPFIRVNIGDELATKFGQVGATG